MLVKGSRLKQAFSFQMVSNPESFRNMKLEDSGARRGLKIFELEQQGRQCSPKWCMEEKMLTRLQLRLGQVKCCQDDFTNTTRACSSKIAHQRCRTFSSILTQVIKRGMDCQILHLHYLETIVLPQNHPFPSSVSLSLTLYYFRKYSQILTLPYYMEK